MTDHMYENIRVAAMVNQKRISKQDLKIIQQKYGIDDMDGCLAFCRQENIEVYDEEERVKLWTFKIRKRNGKKKDVRKN